MRVAERRRLRGVISAGMKGVAAADAAHSPPSSNKGPVLTDRSDKVVAAGRLKATLPTEDGTQEYLVQADAED